MKPTRSPSRFRLIDGVILAAIGLLTLKTAGLFADRPEPPKSPAARTSFGHVLSYARTNFEPVDDPMTTGSVTPAKKEAEPAPAAAKDEPVKETASAAPPAPPTEQQLLNRLGERRQELQERAREVDERRRLMEEQERRIDERLSKIQAVEEDKKKASEARQAAEAASMKGLVVMYESMKPKEAARVFERLPQDVLVSVVTLMNSRKMSEVLAAMSPESAEKLTVALAKRARGSGPERPADQGLPAGELPAINPFAPQPEARN